MFDAISRFAVRRWPIVLAATLIFCGYGWTAFRALPIEAFPDVTNPMVEVVGIYPGQAAEEVEKRVTVELERALAGTPNVVDLRSVSVFGLSLLTLTFEEGVPDFTMRTHVAERLRDAELPEGAFSVMGPQATPVGQIFRYTLEGPKSLRELRAIQDFVVERRLRSVDGVAEVVTFGGFERQYQVRIDPSLLAAFDVSVGEVHEAVSRATRNAGGGYVGIGSQEFVVRGVGTPTDPAEIGYAVIREVDGVPILVRDVAVIVEGSTPRRGAVGRGERDEVIEGIVLLRRGENPSDVLEALHERVRQLNEEILPEGVYLDTFYDRNDLVAATLTTVGKNLLEGALLVLFVVYLFLRTFRGTLIIAVVIPVSMLTAFVGLKMMGLPANLISLGAIDFGILVDGAIIVLEATLHELHRPPREGETKEGRIERVLALVARPVGFAMLIIIAALFPIFTLQQTEGRIFAPMAYTYAFALLGALVSAMVIVPALERVLLPAHWKKGEPRWLAWLGDGYGRILRRAQGARRAALPIALASAASMGAYGAGIGTEFLPELNEGGFYITSIFPSTVSLDETRAQVSKMRSGILETPEVVDLLSHIGRPEDATQAEGSNNAEFFIQLAPENTWREGYGRAEIEDELRESLMKIPGVEYNFSQPITDRVFETISGIIGQVVVKFYGDDFGDMTGSAERYREALSSVDGITDLALYQAGDTPQLRIDLDREALARRGLSVDDVQETIEVALGGLKATEVWDGERRFAVALRLPDSIRSNPEQLARLQVGPSDRRVTLGEIAQIEVARGRQSIWREDFSRFVALKFNVRGRDLGSTVADAQAATSDLELPEGVWTRWGGEFENQERAMRRLGVTLPFALAAITAILFLIFRRVRPVAMVLAFLPLSVTGAVAGLRMVGENFSVSGAVGCIALIGAVVLAGVVICSRIDEAEQEADPNPMATGARVAFRPVLLTITLALLGLVPAATSQAMGSETQRPFAIAIVGGLLISAPAILFLLPLAYGRAQRPGGRRERDEDEPDEGSAPDEDDGKSRVSAAAIATLVLGLLAVPAAATAQTETPRAETAQAETAQAETSTFTLEQAIGAMEREHPLFGYSEHMVRAAEEDITAAGRWENPSLDLSWVTGVTQPSYDAAGASTFAIEQPLELSGRPEARQRSARAEMEATQAEMDGLRARLALDVERAFAELSGAHRIEELARRSVDDLERARVIVDARVAAGAAPAYDADRLAAALADARTLVALAAGEKASARARFDAAVGPGAARLQGAPAVLPDPSPPPALATLTNEATTNQPSIRAARARARALEALADLERREVFPGVNVRAIGGFGQAPGQWDLGVGLSIPLPILDFGQGAIAAADARALAADERAAAIENTALASLRSSWEQARAAALAYAAYENEVEGLEERMQRRVESAYRDGRLSVLELVDGLRTVREIERRRVELALERVRADIALRTAVRALDGS